MRFACLCAITATILLISCSKSSHSSDARPGLTGDWRLYHYGGGFAGIYVDVPADSIVLLSFRADGTYEQQENGVSKAKGTFKVDSVSGSVPGGRSWTLFLDGGSMPITYTVIHSDTLRYGFGYLDGYDFSYVRVR
ncbi:hypothetical protein [Puia sp.]|jgi:hypothetical protein|uniref:hypothetical protein n=1 Tax=Puia sp. TaxID=2045100 RepID=UPI002F3FA7E6